MSWAQFQSLHNEFWFFLRRTLRWRRGSYSEQSDGVIPLPAEAQEINTRYHFTDVGLRLLPRRWIYNLATLWYLERFLGKISLPKKLEILETGCQNFSRLPALRAFFHKKSADVLITGIELDAFVPVQGFCTLWDQAQYFLKMQKDQTQYLAGDYFHHRGIYDLVICFYPFVSAAPALAWGLPARFSGAQRWLQAFERGLRPGGYVLVVHQGDWEERDFDEARAAGSALQLVHRETLECPFFKTKFPAHGSLYQKSTFI